MDYSKAFHLVAKASKKSAVPCVLIGGFAVNFYKVTRNTLDVDFLTTKDTVEVSFKNRMLKDLPDVVRLIKGNDIEFKSDDFRGLCLKYGNEEIYKNILGFFET